MSEKVIVGVERDSLVAAIGELLNALEPMVPYKIDPLAFSRAAHEVKDNHIQKALSLLPADFIEIAKRSNTASSGR